MARVSERDKRKAVLRGQPGQMGLSPASSEVLTHLGKPELFWLSRCSRLRSSILPHVLKACAFILLSAVSVLALIAGPPQSQDIRELGKYIPKLERNLKQNIAPFWLSKSLDRKNDGYIINF